MTQGAERLERAREVGARVRTLREKQSITQGELASRAGVSRDVVVRLELGKRLPHAPNVRKIADALGIGIGDLMSEEAGILRAGLKGEEAVVERGASPGRAVRERPRMVLAVAHQREADEDGEGGGLDLVEVLGGAEALEDLRRALERARGAEAADAGMDGGPRLAHGEGVSDEVIAQRDARYR